MHGRNCDLMWKKQTQLLGTESEVALGKISNRFDEQMDLSNKYMLPLGQGQGEEGIIYWIWEFSFRVWKVTLNIFSGANGYIPCPSLQSSSLIELWSCIYIYKYQRKLNLCFSFCDSWDASEQHSSFYSYSALKMQSAIECFFFLFF